MAEPVTIRDWSRGSDNLSPADRLPPGFVRLTVNADPVPGGKLALRSGYEQVYEGADVRGVLALGERLLVADGSSLVEVNTRTRAHRVVRTIDPAGRFVGAEHAGVLYFCTVTECLEYDGTTVRSWGVPDVTAQPEVRVVPAGTLRAGHYQVAMTYVDDSGREGGTDAPAVVSVAEGAALEVVIPPAPSGSTANLYVGSVDGGTLYFQGAYGPGVVNVGAVRDDTRVLRTALRRAPTPGDIMVSHNGCLYIAQGRYLMGTMPLTPHLLDRAKLFFQFPSDIGALLSAGPLYVSADVSYAITDAETDAPQQRVVLHSQAIKGTAVQLPDRRGAWLTRYGQAITTVEGGMELVNRKTFSVGDRQSGAACLLETNGNQLIVTTTQGGNSAGAMVAPAGVSGE